MGTSVFFHGNYTHEIGKDNHLSVKIEHLKNFLLDGN